MQRYCVCPISHPRKHVKQWISLSHDSKIFLFSRLAFNPKILQFC